MATILILILTFCAIPMVYIIIQVMKIIQKLRENIDSLKTVPQLPRHWFFGNVLEIQNWSAYVLRMQREFIDKGSKMYCIWIFHKPIIMVSHPDTARDLLRSSEPKDEGIIGYGGLLPWLGQSLLISNGTKWERNRRLLTPAFHFDILKPYVKVFNEVADTLINKMAKCAGESKSFEIFEVAGLATLDSLLQCSLSYKGNVQQIGKKHPYVTAVRRLSDLVVHRTLKLHHFPDCIYKWTADGKEFYKNCDYVHDFASKIISERRRKLNENPDVLKKRYLDFLDILVTAKDGDGKGLSDEEIRSEVDTFMFAGHDTTATVLSWSLYALGKYPEQQTKVYDEVKEIIGDKTNVEWEDLSKMKYLSCFIKEVMRMYTPVPVTSRTISKPMTIEGVTFPTGTNFDFGFYHIHHHPDVWSDPWEFKPERFESEDILNKDPYSFVPFSAAPRNCIGQNFAQNEDKVMLARIVNRFEVSLDENHEVEPYIEAVLRTTNGIYIKVKDRNIDQS